MKAEMPMAMNANRNETHSARSQLPCSHGLRGSERTGPWEWPCPAMSPACATAIGLGTSLGLLALLRRQPLREVSRLHHLYRRPHQRVAGAAQLGTDQHIPADPGRGGVGVVHDARHGVGLNPELGDVEGVDHVV